MILATALAKEHVFFGQDVVWHKERWERGTVLENRKAKLIWDIQFHLRKTTTTRRPNLILEDKEEKRIWICDMACPQQHNLETKRVEKSMKYCQLTFEMREKRPGYLVTVILMVVGSLIGRLKKTINELSKLIPKREIFMRTVSEMQKTNLIDSESIIWKVMSGLVQGVKEET